MEPLIIYSDGACFPNPGPGGWGAVLIYGSQEKELIGGDYRTTNNRMELMGAICALEALKRPCAVTLYTDSQYVITGMTNPRTKWKRELAKGKTPINVDLWLRLVEASKPHQIAWQWVRGHNGNPGNERADRLSVEGMQPYLHRFRAASL